MTYQKLEHEDVMNFFNKYKILEPFNNCLDDYKFILNLDSYLSKIKQLKNKLIFSAHGCAGTAGAPQKDIAAGISLQNIQFNLLLGDNIYHPLPRLAHGIQSDSDRKKDIQKFYTDIYKNDLTSFCILGNHDYNYWSNGNRLKIKNKEGHTVAMRQVKATYDQMSNLKGWQMPYRYYALYSKTFKTAIFILDSNTYLIDDEQKNWLQMVYKEFDTPGFCNYKILCMHHPLQSYGKRFAKENTKMYFGNTKSPDVIHGMSIGTLMETYFYKHNIQFDIALCAHDHFLEVRQLERGTFQCVSGSGGADQSGDEKDNAPSVKAAPLLEKLKKGMYKEENKLLLNKNGFVEIHISKEEQITVKFSICIKQDSSRSNIFSRLRKKKYPEELHKPINLVSFTGLKAKNKNRIKNKIKHEGKINRGIVEDTNDFMTWTSSINPIYY